MLARIGATLTRSQTRTPAALSGFASMPKAPTAVDVMDEDTAAIYEAAKDFADSAMLPHAAEWDSKPEFPRETLKEAAALGFGGVYVSEEYGGSGLGRVHAAAVFEALSTACPSTSAYISIHNMCAWMLDSFASDELKKQYLPGLTSMNSLASYCLTEPGAGSDAASLSTSAREDGDNYILNGEKAFCSGGSATDLYLVMARTGGDGPSGISCFAMPADTPGVQYGKLEKKLGWNSQPTAAVVMEDVVLPKSAMVGAPGDGFKIAMKALDGGRINIAACSLGGADAAISAAKSHMLVRKQFGKTLSNFQHLAFTLADMGVGLHASRLMVHDAARKLDAKDPTATVVASMAKRFATETCWNIVDDALQLHGGYGYLKEYPVERYLRDLRVHRILEGTNEIMRLIISRSMLAE